MIDYLSKQIMFVFLICTVVIGILFLDDIMELKRLSQVVPNTRDFKLMLNDH